MRLILRRSLRRGSRSGHFHGVAQGYTTEAGNGPALEPKVWSRDPEIHNLQAARDQLSSIIAAPYLQIGPPSRKAPHCAFPRHMYGGYERDFRFQSSAHPDRGVAQAFLPARNEKKRAVFHRGSTG